MKLDDEFEIILTKTEDDDGWHIVLRDFEYGDETASMNDRWNKTSGDDSDILLGFATRAAMAIGRYEKRTTIDDRSFVWTSKTIAKDAFKAACAAIKTAKKDRNKPFWHDLAIAAGWRPPT